MIGIQISPDSSEKLTFIKYYARWIFEHDTSNDDALTLTSTSHMINNNEVQEAFIDSNKIM